MTLFRALSIASFGSLLVLACAKDEGDGDAFEQRDRFVADFCGIVATCCGQALQTPVTEEECRKTVLVLDQAMIEDANARSACILQLQAANAKGAAQFCPSYGRLDIPACPDVRRVANKGTAKPGDPCKTAAECAPSFEGPVECNNGGCQVTVRGKEGDIPCGATNDDGVESSVGVVPGPTRYLCYAKEDGLYCDSVSNACSKPKGLGSDCTKTEECGRTAYCNATSKKCQVRKSDESSCDDTSECQAPFHCDEGFCRDDLDVGAACKNGEMCKSNVCTNGKCAEGVGKDPRLQPVCTAPAAQPTG